MHRIILAVMACLLTATWLLPAVPAGNEQSQGARVETTQLQGFIGCAIGFYSIVSRDWCDFSQLPGHVGAPDDHAVTVAADPVTAARYELVWQTSSPTGGDRLSLQFPPDEAQSPRMTTDDQLVEGFIVQGRSPVVLEIEASIPRDPLFHFETPEEVLFNVRSVGSSVNSILADPTQMGGASGLVYQQPYLLCVTLAYRGAALPAEPAC